MSPSVRLVEQSTLRRMGSVSESMSKKANGENLVRVILLALVFFVIVQIACRVDVQDHSSV